MNTKKAIETLKFLKEKENLKIYDSHVHPLDVMGVLQMEDYNRKDIYKPEPTLIDKLKFNKIANLLMRLTSFVAPKIVKNSVRKIYENTNENVLLSEMDSYYIDSLTLVPISPWTTVDEIFKYYNNKRFIYLGSVDIHKIDEDEIEQEIDRQIRSYNIKGIKLHPNLQGFYPQPSHNGIVIEKKLEHLYEVISNRNLYILFHAGYTNLFSKNRLYRKRSFALLKNFINEDGRSEIFDVYNIPIVLAHLGNYARIKRDFYYLKRIADRYRNIYFDTASVDKIVIGWFLENYGSKRLLFGSDALYHNILTSIEHCIDSIIDSNIKEKKEECISNIFGRNYEDIIR